MTIPRLISADSHVVEPPDLWTERIDARFRDRAPRMVRGAGSFEGDCFVCEELSPMPITSLAVAGVDSEEYPDRMFGNFENVPAGGWDPVARVLDQEKDSVDAEVLYTSVGMVMFGLQDGELRAAIFRAFNDWLAEFCSHAPRRFAGIGLIPMDDVDVAVRELERAARLGLKGAMIWGAPPADRPYDSSIWDPLWAAAQSTGLPLSLHILTGRQGPGVDMTSVMRGYGLLHHGIQHALSTIIFGGVLERFPELRIISVENDIGWLAHFIQRIDHAYEKYRSLETRDVIPELPSFYCRRQVYATFQDAPVGIRLRDDIGVDNIMWASDFPHSDSTWPRSREIVERDFTDVPEDQAGKIVRYNCAQLYELG